MAKNIIICFSFLCITISTRAVVLENCIQKTYTAEIGVREKSGKNDGEKVEQYLASVNRKKGDAWCAAFVNWCLESCGVKTIKSGWSPSWFTENKVVYKNGKGKPQTGDVFGIYFSNKKRIAHVGFIDKWGDDYVITVEGNTNEAGSREGDGVYKKRRLKRQIYKVSRWKNF